MTNALLKAVQQIQPNVRGTNGLNLGPATKLPISIHKYKYRVRKNTQFLQHNTNKNGILAGSSEYYFSDGSRFNCIIETNKMHDFKGALPLGGIPINSNRGADSVLMHRGVIREIENKTRTFDPSKVFLGEYTGIYTAKRNGISNPGKRTTMYSAIEAKYQIATQACLQSKFIDTYLTIFDQISGAIIEIIALAGYDVKDILLSKDGGGLGQPTIKLSKFLEEGVIIPQTQILVPKVGLDNFEDILEQCCPVVADGMLIPNTFDTKKYIRLIKKNLK